MNTTRTALGLLTAALVTGADSSALGTSSGNLIGLEARGRRMVHFDAGSPGTILAVVPLSGLATGEALVGIDVRPSTGELFGIGNTSRVYQIDVDTGLATPKGAGPFTPTLFGRGVGIDFNPVPDRLRTVTNSGQSLRLNSDTGVVAGTDTSLFYVPGDAGAGSTPYVVAAAYTQSFAGATSTTLYGIDSARDTLVRIGGLNGPPSPNLGEVTTVGALGVDTLGFAGLDISPFGGAFAVMNVPGETMTKLYTINLGTGAATLQGILGSGMRLRDVAVRAPSAPRAFGVSGDNRLVSFLVGRPGTILADVGIAGLQTGETVEGLDFRPATGELFCLGSTSRVYRIDTSTGAATQVGSGAFTPALSGASFGFDFNPVVDRIRTVSDAGQNLRLNPNTGAVAGTDTNLAYAAGDPGAGSTPRVVAEAYVQNFAGATSTTLYAIDSARDVLVTQGNVNGTPNNPNGGMLFSVGALGIDAQDAAGFDVTPFGGAFAALTPAGASAASLYTLNVSTGAATLVGAIGTMSPLRALAFEPPAASRALALTSSNQLVSFALGTPGAPTSTVSITGLQPSETVLGIDARATTGVVNALGSTSRLYTINAVTGAATAIGAVPFSPVLAGTAFGVDFNTTVDRVRVVSDAGQNLRLNPNTGGVAATDTTLAYAAGDPNAGATPREVAVAYDRSFAGATVTTLFGIDSSLDVLVTQGSVNSSPTSPNSGQLFTVGALGVDTGDLTGFDVSIFGGAFATLTPTGGTSSTLYTVNLTTGAATMVGAIGGGATVLDLALIPPGL